MLNDNSKWQMQEVKNCNQIKRGSSDWEKNEIKYDVEL